MSPPGKTDALILAGAVAKGAFEAGALDLMSRRGLSFRRIVSSSAGSLNAVVFAAGARVGRATEVAASLVALWSDYASWNHVFEPQVGAIFGLRGLSGTDKVRALMVEQVSRWLDAPDAPPPERRVPIELRLVVTLLNGTVEQLGPGRATTFERVLPFDGDDLDDPERRARVIDAALASAAFPLVFLPVDLGAPLGPAVDGGAVDNAPIHEAVHGSPVDRVFVISTDPAEVPPIRELHGDALVTRLADILINERLFRDMADAHATNRALLALDQLVADGVLTPAQLARVHAALAWEELKPLEIVPVRPPRPLPGGAFSGFFSDETRRAYIELGREAAAAALNTTS